MRGQAQVSTFQYLIDSKYFSSELRQTETRVEQKSLLSIQKFIFNKIRMSSGNEKSKKLANDL
jgi:hypothetical protein